MSYKVKLNVFEGPFDLLVYLIENAQMSIYDIQVAEITGQYLEYIEKMKQLDIAVAAEFMVLAAALLEIKSKMILPRVNVDDNGMIVEEDPRAELVERIIEYKRFKAAAEMLESLEEESMKIFEKPQEDISQYTEEPDEYLSLDIKQFVAAFNNFLSGKQRIEEVRKHYTRVERQKQSAEAKMRFIKNFFKKDGKQTVSFQELLTENSKYEKVLTFTSLLEMVRQKTVSLRQKVIYGDIAVTLLPQDDGGSHDD